MALSTISEKTTKLELQAARSELLDAFAEAESAVARLLAECGLPPNKASLGQNIGRIRKLPASLANNSLPAILDCMVELNEVRTEVVHRQMHVAAMQGTTKAIFIERNANPDIPPYARVISLDQFKKVAAKVRSLAKQLSEMPR